METAASTAPATGRIRGVFLAESLQIGAGFDGHGMHVIHCSRYVVSGTSEDQPEIWTAIDFDAPEGESEPLAEELSQALAGPGGWYVNWSSADEVTVVFRGRVFRYPRGDTAGRAEAQEHGRKCGVPEAQLDWTD